jgi:cellulose synthase/poly-beta-1,6-N-acetylglucosamine synthase-like glycosyltransferase
MQATDRRAVLAGLPRMRGRAAPHDDAPDQALARLVLRDGLLRAPEVQAALAEAAACRVPLAEYLDHAGLVAGAALAGLVAEQSGLPLADPAVHPPDPRLIDALGADRCLQLGVLPLRRIGGAVQVALARPADWARLHPMLQATLGPVTPAHAPAPALQGAIARARGIVLQRQAEARLPARLSARSLPAGVTGPVVPLVLLALGALALLAPGVLVGGLVAWLVLTLLAVMALRLAALVLAWRGPGPVPACAAPVPLRLPVVSVLVPLYGEPDIAPRLLQRLGRLDYPRALLDVVIVLEAKDRETRAALDACHLPGWMRVVTVPDGPITTKPRAMNFALDFCRGSIIGIYDAEDAPDPDQIRKVVQRFAETPAQVACLQGALDYYNPRTNLLARLFTAEYAAWFRVMMPALQRLGWPMPLGGTTLFLRRAVLESLGAWDAHNVTEDADLGVRLARHGYRTEMLPSTTHEEANCRLRPWVRQRSRWIKGHILTWVVHMRDPVALWRDLGPWGFVGYQLVFLGAQSQVLLAPLMWSFWLIVAGLPHPVQAILPGGTITALAGLFVLSELLVMAVAVVGLARTRHQGLGWVAPLLHLYHPLGAIAGWRAVWEAVVNPFYWAKTSHGLFDMAEAAQHPPAAPARLPAPLPAVAAAGAAAAALPLSLPLPAAPGAAPLPLPAAPAAASPAVLRAPVFRGAARLPHPAADRLARSLANPDPVLAARVLADAAAAQRTRTSPASIFSRVSKAREIWVRSAS